MAAAAMEIPNFRLYMERRMHKGSTEPNLHILTPPPFDPWPFVFPPDTAPPPPAPKPFNKYRAVAHLCPGGMKGLLSNSDEEMEDADEQVSSP